MPAIKRFAIKGLYDERNIEIPFDSNIRIVVAENGYGKTTVLNALYALAAGEANKIRNINFSTIEIDFDDGEKFEIKKSDISISPSDIKEVGFVSHFKSRIGAPAFHDLVNSYFTLPKPRFRGSSIFQHVRKRMDMTPDHLMHFMREIISDESVNTAIAATQAKLKIISEKFGFKCLYLPTYRRVEHDFRDLLIDDSEPRYDDSINFGMRDVDKRITEVTKEILTSSVEWFSKVNGQMLSQLIEGFALDPTLKASVQKPDAIKIVLDRIGSNINANDKTRILKLIENRDIFVDHDPLIYFLGNLSKVYEQQKDNDLRIQNFTDVCNRYLGDKKFEYNESSVTLEIIRRKSGKKVDIENLSSGEKQIISLFSKLYLQKDESVAIFFDEPELSLSIEWQKTLLPDIVNSGKCAFLFTTTHSPFIFENELMKQTIDLNSFIKEL